MIPIGLCHRYALTEMAQDLPDLPIGMLTDLHLKRGLFALQHFCLPHLSVSHRQLQFAGEEVLLEWIRDSEPASESSPAADAFWIEISNKWFTLFPTTRPYIMRGFEQIADNVRLHTILLTPSPIG